MATSRKRTGARGPTAPPEPPVPPAAPPASPAPIAGVVMQRNELRQTWTQPLQLGSESELPRELFAEPEAEAFPADPVAAFLETLDYDQGYTLRVDLLTEWDKDGRTGVKAPKRFCRQYQFDLENYLNLIAEDFGAGAYWLTLRRTSDGQVVKFWVEHIAPRRVPVTPPAGVFAPSPSNGGALVASIPPTAGAVAAIREIGAFAKELATIKQALGWDNEPPQREALPPPPSSPSPEPLQDRLLSLMVERAAASGDDNKLERILSAVLGREEKDSPRGFDFIGMLERIAAPLLPTLAQMFLQRAGAQPGQLPPGPQQSYVPYPAPPGGAPPMPIGPLPAGYPEAAGPIAPSPVGSIPPPPDLDGLPVIEDDMQENMDRLLDSLVESLTGMSRQGVIDTIVIERGAGWVRDFERAFPMAGMFISGLVYGTPEQVLNTLESYHTDFAGVSRLPLAVEFIAALQTRLKGGPPQ